MELIKAGLTPRKSVDCLPPNPVPARECLVIRVEDIDLIATRPEGLHRAPNIEQLVRQIKKPGFLR